MCDSEKILSYDEWCDLNGDAIDIELAETGCDRELDFDPEKEYDKRYEIYLNTHSI